MPLEALDSTRQLCTRLDTPPAMLMPPLVEPDPRAPDTRTRDSEQLSALTFTPSLTGLMIVTSVMRSRGELAATSTPWVVPVWLLQSISRLARMVSGELVR